MIDVCHYMPIQWHRSEDFVVGVRQGIVLTYTFDGSKNEM